MDNGRLLESIAKKISNSSRHYTAEMSKEPRSYHGRWGGEMMSTKAHGICLRRYDESYGLPTSGFVFEPEIVKYVTKMSRHDKGFSERLAAYELNADDIELMIREMTFNRIKLFMRGRRIFFDEDNYVESLL